MNASEEQLKLLNIVADIEILISKGKIKLAQQMLKTLREEIKK